MDWQIWVDQICSHYNGLTILSQSEQIALLLCSPTVSKTVPEFYDSEKVFSRAVSVLSNDAVCVPNSISPASDTALVSFCRSRLECLGDRDDTISIRSVSAELCEALHFSEYDIAMNNLLLIKSLDMKRLTTASSLPNLVQQVENFVRSGMMPTGSLRIKSTLSLLCMDVKT